MGWSEVVRDSVEWCTLVGLVRSGAERYAALRGTAGRCDVVVVGVG